MPADARPQIYLITPPDFSLDLFPDQLASVLDGAEIACNAMSIRPTTPRADEVGTVSTAWMS